jgi:hypothetical protein
VSIDRLVQNLEGTYNLCEPSAKVKDKKFSKTALYVKANLRLREKPCKSRQEETALSLVSFVCQRKSQDKSCELCALKQKSRQVL